MRKLSGGGVVAAHGHRTLALQSLRRPPHQWGLVADRCVVSKPGQALSPPTGTAAWPSGPSGTLHTSGAWSLMCGSVRVVTNVVNPRCFSCGFRRCCYKRRQSEGFFVENGGFWA